MKTIILSRLYNQAAQSSPLAKWALPAFVILLGIGNSFLQYANDNSAWSFPLILSLAVSLMIIAVIAFPRLKFKQTNNYLLIFGDEHIICRDGDTTMWHIPYGRFAHLEPIAINHQGLVYIELHTTDGDSFRIPSPQCEHTLLEIQAAVSQIKNPAI